LAEAPRIHSIALLHCNRVASRPHFVIMESKVRIIHYYMKTNAHSRAKPAAFKGIYLHLDAARLLEGQIRLRPFYCYEVQLLSSTFKCCT